MSIYRTSWVDQEAQIGGVPNGWTFSASQGLCQVVVEPNSREYPSGASLRFTSNSTNTFRRAIWTDGASVEDQQILALVSTSKLTTSGVYCYVLGRYVDADNNYRAYFVSNDTFRIARWNGGVVDVLASASFGWSANTNYWILLECVGTTVRAKVWEDGEAEPGSWTVSAVDSDVSLTEGRQGVGVFNGIGSSPGTLVHEFRVATASDTVPRGFSAPRRPIVLAATTSSITVKPFDGIITANATMVHPNNLGVSAWRARATDVGNNEFFSGWVAPGSPLVITGLSAATAYDVQIQARDATEEAGDWSGIHYGNTIASGRTLIGEDFTSYISDAGLAAVWPIRWEAIPGLLQFTLNDDIFRYARARMLSNGLHSVEWTEVPHISGYQKVRVLVAASPGAVADIFIPFSVAESSPPLSGWAVKYDIILNELRIGTLSDEITFTSTNLASVATSIGFFYIEAEYNPDTEVIRGRVYDPWEEPPAWQVSRSGIPAFESPLVPLLAFAASFSPRSLVSVEWEYESSIIQPVSGSIVSLTAMEGEATAQEEGGGGGGNNSLFLTCSPTPLSLDWTKSPTGE